MLVALTKPQSSIDFIGDNKAVTGTNWPTVEAYIGYGGPTDKWGCALTPAWINSPYFGVGIQARNNNASSRTASIDHIRITVYYHVPVPFDDGYVKVSVGGNWVEKPVKAYVSSAWVQKPVRHAYSVPISSPAYGPYRIWRPCPKISMSTSAISDFNASGAGSISRQPLIISGMPSLALDVVRMEGANRLGVYFAAADPDYRSDLLEIFNYFMSEAGLNLHLREMTSGADYVGSLTDAEANEGQGTVYAEMLFGSFSLLPTRTYTLQFEVDV